jgi:predicted nucleic acid-binding protein
MPEVVISDTSTLIIFQNIDRLDILHKVYGFLFTTPEIAEEFGLPLPEWLKVKSVKDKKYQSFLETQVDRGEASAIALASEHEDALLILDDLKARKLAKELNFKITGTLGIIHKAKQLSVIEKVKPVVDDIQKTNFRISDKIVKELLKLNDE